MQAIVCIKKFWSKSKLEIWSGGNSVAICYNNKSMDRISSEEQMPVEFLKEFFGQMVWFLVEVSCFYSSQSWIILWSSSLSGQKYVLLIL